MLKDEEKEKAFNFQQLIYFWYIDLVYLATWVSDTSDPNATWVCHERRECDTSETQATRVNNFDFDNNTSENVSS